MLAITSFIIHYLGWHACDRSWRQLPEVQVFRAGEANSLVNTCRFWGCQYEQKTAPLFRFVVYYMYWLRDAAWSELSRRVDCCYQNCCGTRHGLSAVGVWASAQVVTDG